MLDEVFLAYQPEGVHLVLFGNQLLTLLFLGVLTRSVAAHPTESHTVKERNSARMLAVPEESQTP